MLHMLQFCISLATLSGYGCGVPDCMYAVVFTKISDNAVERVEWRSTPYKWDTFYTDDLHRELARIYSEHQNVFIGKIIDTIKTTRVGQYSRVAVDTILKGKVNKDTAIFYISDCMTNRVPSIESHYLFYTDFTDTIPLDSSGIIFGCSVDGYTVVGDTIVPFGYFHNNYIKLTIPLSTAFTPVSANHTKNRYFQNSMPLFKSIQLNVLGRQTKEGQASARGRYIRANRRVTSR